MNSPVYSQTSGPLGDLFASFGVSHSVRVPLRGSFITTAGQPGFDLKTGRLVTTSIRDEISACFNCLEAALRASNAPKGLCNAYKVTVYLLDVRHDPLVLEVWRERCPNHKPTMVTVGVASLAVAGMHVEMTADAIVIDA